MLTIMQKTWAHVQPRRAYPVYVSEFDRLQPDDVVWEPYTLAAVASRAPLGLSSACTENQGLWMTMSAMVYDIAIDSRFHYRPRWVGFRSTSIGNFKFV